MFRRAFITLYSSSSNSSQCNEYFFHNSSSQFYFVLKLTIRPLLTCQCVILYKYSFDKELVNGMFVSL